MSFSQTSLLILLLLEAYDSKMWVRSFTKMNFIYLFCAWRCVVFAFGVDDFEVPHLNLQSVIRRGTFHSGGIIFQEGKCQNLALMRMSTDTIIYLHTNHNFYILSESAAFFFFFLQFLV